jgi:hypothetical protein
MAVKEKEFVYEESWPESFQKGKVGISVAPKY